MSQTRFLNFCIIVNILTIIKCENKLRCDRAVCMFIGHAGGMLKSDMLVCIPPIKNKVVCCKC